MKDLIRYAAIMGLVLFVILRSDYAGTDTGSVGDQVIAGALTELSETDVGSTVQYLTLRDQAIDRLRSEFPKGTFSPPLWFVAQLSKVNLETPVPEAQSTFLAVSKRLYSKQKGEYFERGRRAVRDL